MKYELAQKILDRIIDDNEFSLKMSMHMRIRQDTLFRLVKTKSDSLRLPEQVAFYKQEGYAENEIFNVTQTKQ